MVDRMKSARYEKNGWSISEEHFLSREAYEREFLNIELGSYRSQDFYRSRLEMINFSGKGTVLDAGCGVGQWSIALASLNKKVFGIDFSQSRIESACHLKENLGVKNVDFRQGSLEVLPYGDETFDAVFCYGVFMFTNTEKTLSEFQRVLKPGGKLYLNYNSCGWYAHLIIDRGWRKKNFSIIRQALRMIFRYFMGSKSQILIRESWMRQMLKNYGFGDLEIASEGWLRKKLKPNQEKPKSIYQTHYYGMRAIVEVMSTKV